MVQLQRLQPQNQLLKNTKLTRVENPSRIAILHWRPDGPNVNCHSKSWENMQYSRQPSTRSVTEPIGAAYRHDQTTGKKLAANNQVIKDQRHLLDNLCLTDKRSSQVSRIQTACQQSQT